MKYIIFLGLTTFFCFRLLAQEQRDYLQIGIREYEVTNYAKAVSVLDLEIERNPSAEAYYYRALAKARLKRYAESLKDFTLSLSLNPHKAESYMYRGCIHYELEQYKEAIIDFSKALEYRSNYYEAYLYRAESETKIELYKEALQDYQSAIMINPHVSSNYLERGQLFLSLKRYKEASADFDEYISKYPMDSYGYMYRARAKRGLNDEQGAIEDDKKANDLKTNEKLYLNEGIESYNLKNYKTAIENLNMAILKNDKDGRAYLYRAWSQYWLKNYPASLLDFNKSIELNKDADSYYGRAYLKHTLRDYTAAIVDYDQCIQLNPSSSQFLINRGRCKMQSGDNNGAKFDFEKAIILNEENPDGYFNMALLRKNMGELDQACNYFKQAADYGHVEAADDWELYCK